METIDVLVRADALPAGLDGGLAPQGGEVELVEVKARGAQALEAGLAGLPDIGGAGVLAADLRGLVDRVLGRRGPERRAGPELPEDVLGLLPAQLFGHGPAEPGEHSGRDDESRNY